MEHSRFEKLVIQAVEDLPHEFKVRLENIDVVVEDAPSRDHTKNTDVHHKCLVMGLYQGVPLSRRSHYYGMVMPDKILIFKENIERICKTDAEIIRLVTHTVKHEIAHHFGISDDRLRELGVY